jgi:hypothetical protein
MLNIWTVTHKYQIILQTFDKHICSQIRKVYLYLLVLQYQLHFSKKVFEVSPIDRNWNILVP